jgi:SNF2 family DNA or RNA helicase
VSPEGLFFERERQDSWTLLDGHFRWKETVSHQFLLGIAQQCWANQYPVFLGEKEIRVATESDFSFTVGVEKSQKTANLETAEIRIETATENAQDTEALSPQTWDWLSLNPQVFFRGESLDLERVQQLPGQWFLETAEAIYALESEGSSEIKNLLVEWNRVFSPGARKPAGSGKSSFPLPKNKFLELLVLEQMGVKVSGDASWNQVRAIFQSMGSPRAIESWIEQSTFLKSYQKAGVQWLWDLYRLGLGGVLADEMGLGKSVQTLTFLQRIFFEDSRRRALLVVPPSILHNWENEIAKFTPELNFRFFSPAMIEGPIGPGLMIVSYGMLAEHQKFLSEQIWEIILFDEAQYLKTMMSKRTQAARSLKSAFKIAITGTPLENNYEEFFAIVDLVLPGALGQRESFNRTYGSQKVIPVSEVRRLRSLTQPIVLRREKSQVRVELPPKIEAIVSLDLDEQQKAIYRDIAMRAQKQIQSQLLQKNEKQLQIEMLSALMKLRQVCSDPRGLEGVNYPQDPPKIQYLEESLAEVVRSGSSALVFTQFLASLNNIQKSLERCQIPHFVIHGSIPALKRKEILSEFQNFPTGAVLLMTLKTGGVGLNLTKASYVFHVEPWWNPSVENQATDRAHRLGQQQSVNVYRLILRYTLEEKIEKLKSDKRKKFELLLAADGEVIGGDLGGRSTLTQEDFRFLLNN